MNFKRYLPVVALALIMVLVISACAAPAAAPATTDAPAAAPTAEETTPADAPAASENDKPVIAGVVFQSDTFMQTVQNGLQAAADEAGAELILGNTENDLAKESSMIDDYITRGVDAIVITPISCRRLAGGLEEGQGSRHHHRLLQHLRQRGRHCQRLPGDQE